MTSIERSIDIDAPRAHVWAVLEDVRRLPEFSPSTVEVVAPKRLAKRGETFEQTVKLGGKSFTSTWTVREITAGERLVIEGSVLPGTHYRMTEAITPIDDEHTTFTLTMDYRLPFGPLGKLAGKLGAEKRATDEAGLVLSGVRHAAEARATAR
jgi:uncharacterized membrane protein